jgi:hypothetical protein
MGYRQYPLAITKTFTVHGTVYLILRYNIPQGSPEPRTIVTGQQPLYVRFRLYLIHLEHKFPSQFNYIFTHIFRRNLM